MTCLPHSWDSDIRLGSCTVSKLTKYAKLGSLVPTWPCARPLIMNAADSLGARLAFSGLMLKMGRSAAGTISMLNFLPAARVGVAAAYESG